MIKVSRQEAREQRFACRRGDNLKHIKQSLCNLTCFASLHGKNEQTKKERTQEIGVRKAIGAKPKSIIALIMQESIVITVISGFVGVGLGVLTLNLIGDSLEAYFIKSPSVGWGLILMAFISLVLSGLIAGFVPAYRAAKIKPIEALRAE